ncbi:MAG TPA: ATP-binding protein [Thermoanaerobaculia bacterium]|nr:ATP-binding protein [Thermoanaerobaculia bacterium]
MSRTLSPDVALLGRRFAGGIAPARSRLLMPVSTFPPAGEPDLPSVAPPPAGAASPDAEQLGQRVLVLAPTGRDGELACSVLGRAGVDCLRCDDLRELCANLQAGVGAALLSEEAFAQVDLQPLVNWLGRQAPWSDLPILVLATNRADSTAVAQAMASFGNVTVLERPLRVSALVSAVRTALRARGRQYEAREHLHELERSERELREADRRKDEFLAMLAHELRNPLAPIQNSLHILQLSERHDPAAGRVLPMMQRQLNHIVRLVDDLLEVSRITRGKIQLVSGRVEVASVVRSALDTSRPWIEAGEHHLVVEVPDEPLVVEGDAVRLAQVLSNLLNNAAKFTEAGGHIRLTVQRDGAEVEIAVADDGRGIPRHMLMRVFDLFTQVEDGVDPAQQGLGIGLTLVRSLVALHGGSVEAVSDGHGRGTELRVRLPLLESQRPRPERQDRADAAGKLLHRILVVDDNRDAADTLGVLLELLGAEVHVVYSGPEAIEALGDHRPTVVLLDIGMPGMDGHEVARRIRRQQEHRGVALIALTGWGQEEDRRRSQLAGFDHHLVKPVDIAALQSLLEALEERPPSGGAS